MGECETPQCHRCGSSAADSVVGGGAWVGPSDLASGAARTNSGRELGNRGAAVAGEALVAPVAAPGCWLAIKGRRWGRCRVRRGRTREMGWNAARGCEERGDGEGKGV